MSLAPKYIQDKTSRDGDEELEFDGLLNKNNLIRIRVLCRLREAVVLQGLISYIGQDENQDDN